MKLKTGIINLWLSLVILYMYRKHIWDTQKNIEAEEKEAQNIEEIKNVKKRNNFLINSSYFYFTLNKVVLSSKDY